MKIAQKYSHLNGEEYLIVHRKKLHAEIQEVIASIDADTCKTKISKEKTKKGANLFSPVCLNKEFAQRFQGNRLVGKPVFLLHHLRSRADGKESFNDRTRTKAISC